ncbi:MAG TPA: aminopeptidase [Candidatus Acidoferrales bacterium]|nr:aminopeptidase [Candidatus Acidoferrales bacterium]
MQRRALRGAVNLLRTCAGAKPGENVLVVTDTETDLSIARTIMEAARRLRVDCSTITMEARTLPGEEPPAPVAAAMRSAEVIISPTSTTLFHTHARTAACRAGSRFISMACATMPVLSSGGMSADFPKEKAVLKRLMRRFTVAKRIMVTNPAGTCLTFNVHGRKGYGLSGMATRSGEATGVPDIEAYIAPIESDTNGVLVVDGSTSVTGIVRQPIVITIRHGVAVTIAGGSDAQSIRSILLKTRSRGSFYVGEFGVGLNPLARIRGAIIEDEGVLGTAHLALGDNTKIGGKNSARTHIDFVFKNPHLQLDGETVLRGRRLTI